MPSLAEKLKDRFKPSVFDRLKQSAEAKKLGRGARLHVVPPEPRKTETKRYENAPRLIQQTTSMDTRGTAFVQQVWQSWNTLNSPTACTTSGCTTNNIWNVWHQDTGTGGLISSATTWNTWNQMITITQPTIAVTNTAIWDTWQGQPQPQYGRPSNHFTPEELARRRAEEERYRAEETARNARWHEEERVRVRKTEEANERAMKLLVSMLNDQQRSDLKTHKHFYVEAPSGRLYRIDHGMHGNVKVVDRVTRKIIERLCIQPRGVPAADANLMQKLLIETAEDLFRSHANITLEDGRIVYGKSEDLGAEQLAKVIPIRRAA